MYLICLILLLSLQCPKVTKTESIGLRIQPPDNPFFLTCEISGIFFKVIFLLLKVKEGKNLFDYCVEKEHKLFFLLCIFFFFECS
jgi:hypothetical protein